VSQRIPHPPGDRNGYGGFTYSEQKGVSRGPRYFEVDVDVSSSSVAANIVGLVQGLTKSLCVDMAICLEGHSPEELPESLLGTVRCSHLDLHSAKLLDTTTGAPTIYQPCEESSAIMSTYYAA